MTPARSGAATATVVALFGPTGLGKTEIAVALAVATGTEIVSADSMQVYAGLPIVTNQPTAEQLAGVPHHLVGCVSPAREYSVAEYADQARAVIDEVLDRRGSVIIEGGSGLYLRAALGGLTFGAAGSAVLRDELESLARSDPAQLRHRLVCLDPGTAARVDTDNPRRVARALETVITQGAPLDPAQYSRLWEFSTRADGRGTPRVLCLDVDRARLRERVDARVERMFADGLIDEVRRAVDDCGSLSRTVRQAIGVAEALAVIEGRSTLDQAIDGTKSRTRRYVRRQLTWMRKLVDADIIPTFDRSPDDVAHDIRGRLS
jgi:tRNA dimethylallyltransferase